MTVENRLVDSLPYKAQILRSGEFNFAGRTVSAAAVIERLSSILTDARKERIATVVNERTYNMVTIAEHLYDIGNISAVMRSAECFGFMPFHIIERAGSKYKMSDRISRGTEKWLDIHLYKSAGPVNGSEECYKKLRSEGYKIYATDLNATTSIEDIDFSQKVAVVFGNERDGISEYTREHADGRVLIPMYGFAQSLNISVAAALMFSTIHGARRKVLGKSGDLSEAEKQILTAHYYLRTLDGAENYFK
jgi:tRNA (guanosine-2'-O-)-methyltransferase